MEGAKTTPVDAAGSCHLAGTVYGGRILPLPTKRHPRQQRDHLQRPAKIAEIMHFPPRPDLSGRAAIRTLINIACCGRRPGTVVGMPVQYVFVMMMRLPIYGRHGE